MNDLYGLSVRELPDIWFGPLGLPYGGPVPELGTYILRKQGDEVLTPEGWMYISEFEERYPSE